MEGIEEPQTVTLSVGRQLFNERYLDRWRNDELWEIIERTNEPDPANGQPAGTVSILSRLYEIAPDGGLGAKVAVVHRYQRPDGSTLPDPKALVVDGELIRVRRSD